MQLNAGLVSVKLFSCHTRCTVVSVARFMSSTDHILTCLQLCSRCKYNLLILSGYASQSVAHGSCKNRI